MKYFFRGQRLAVMFILLGMVLTGAASVYAATTIGTDISTGGNLTVGGTATIGPDESTLPPQIQGYVTPAALLVTSVTPGNTSGIVSEVSGGTAFYGVGWSANPFDVDEVVNGDMYVAATGHEVDGYYQAGVRGFGEVEVDNGIVIGVDGHTGAGGYNTISGATLYNLYARTPHISPGSSAASVYGLFIEDQVGATNNYAIKTGLGKVSFGDNVGIGTTTPSTRLVVTAGANATTTVTVGELGLTTSKGCVNMNQANGSPGSFYIVGGVLKVENNYCR